MNEKNIEHLKARLMQLGFAASVEMELRCRICFSRAAFDLVHSEMAGGDVARFVVRVERGDKNLYGLLYYQAALRKEIIIPAELLPLDQKMQAINWKALSGNNFEVLDKPSIVQAFAVLNELDLLGDAGDVLRFKYWVDTPLEILMVNNSQLKNRYEISERFYLIDDNHVISFNEASRFLNNKWMERQVVANKKLLVKKTEAPKSSSIGKGKLLSKNMRRSGRQGMVNES